MPMLLRRLAIAYLTIYLAAAVLTATIIGLVSLEAIRLSLVIILAVMSLGSILITRVAIALLVLSILVLVALRRTRQVSQDSRD
jgi:hypothetical protein